MSFCSLVSWVFSAVCGWAATVISCEMSELVSMPDDSPLIENALT
jgi:hypothetical protein